MVFDFRLSKGGDGMVPHNFSDPSTASCKTDGYAAYDRVGGDGVVHAACWAHAIRTLKDAVKVNHTDAAAITIVTLIEELFAIDACAGTEAGPGGTRPVAAGIRAGAAGGNPTTD